MSGNARQVINMANSIVGVSILSMPFCFKETGLVLGILLVLVSGFITKKTCMFLIRSAIMARRRSYEFLAFHVFGVSGKLFVEMCMILFLIGICISFHVVMGDLAPAIVARFMNIENSSSLRCTLLIGIGILVILPLCLLRNLDNLASMSAFSIMFYFFLITVILWHAFPKLLDGSWIRIAELWRPAGALQVLPICSLALACQSNVFEIYDSVPDPDVPKMRHVVNHAVNLCSALYISVGFLGYVAFVDKDFGGNIIMSFPNSELTEGIKVFFTVSLAISFPLMIFPCRTSIHSLLYRRSNPSSFDLVGNYMPEARFKGITLGILILSLIMGILIPNIEFVLGLLGSTMGMLIALILPSLLFIKVNTKASMERLFAQGIMLMGLLLIVTGTYLNLAHIYEVQAEIRAVPSPESIRKIEPQLPQIDDKVAEGVKAAEVLLPVGDDSATRKEPVAPEPPPEESKIVIKEKSSVDEKDPGKIEQKIEEKEVKKKEDAVNSEREKKKEEEEDKTKSDDTKKEKNRDTLHPDAIQKEEKENEEEIDKGGLEEGNIEQKQAEILEKMEVQHQEQQQILEEQKKILKELKDQKMKQEEDAKKQEENKGNVPVEGPQPIVLNPAVPVLVAQNVEDLVGGQLKSSLNQNNLPAVAQMNPKLAYSNDQILTGQDLSIQLIKNNAPLPLENHQPLDGKELNNQANVVPNGAQNQQGQVIPQAHQAVPLLAVDQQGAINNVNPEGLEANPKVNPQIPVIYYSAKMPGPAANPDVDNYVKKPPSAASPVISQQGPAANVAYHPGPVAGLSVDNPVAEAINPDLKNQPLIAENVVANQPASASNIAAQPAVPDAILIGSRMKAGNAAVPGQRNDASMPVGSMLLSQHEAALRVVNQPASRPYEGADGQNHPPPKLSANVKQPSIKFEDDANRDMKRPVMKESLSQNAGEQIGKLSSDLRAKADKHTKDNAPNGGVISDDVKQKMKSQQQQKHDEERRKRQVEEKYVVDDLPLETNLLRELKWKDVGDFAYDTRHLLWTGRSRRKRRNKGRDEDYYWDET